MYKGFFPRPTRLLLEPRSSKFPVYCLCRSLTYLDVGRSKLIMIARTLPPMLSVVVAGFRFVVRNHQITSLCTTTIHMGYIRDSQQQPRWQCAIATFHMPIITIIHKCPRREMQYCIHKLTSLLWLDSMAINAHVYKLVLLMRLCE